MSVCCKGEQLAEGDQFDELVIKSGRVYESVTVRGILPYGLKIFHASGAITLPAAELPQFKGIFEKLQADAVLEQEAETDTPKVIQPAAWMPSTIQEVADCSLFVAVSKGHDDNGGTTAWNGTGFLCNHGNVTYIYSNYHNFHGAIEFSISDKEGQEITDFVSIEVASNGQGYWEQAGRGGDVIRIRLRNFREKALTIDRVPVSERYTISRSIGVTGNTGGRGKITELEGIVTGIESDHIIVHNAATEGGNSGSPMVDLETFKVIGILTWGEILPDILQEIWLKQPPEVREGINVGAGLATMRFEKTDFKALEEQKLIFEQMKKNVRLLGLMDTLSPHKSGIFVNPNQRVMGDYSVDDLLAESPNHPVVIELTKLDRYLSKRAESNIGMNNGDVLKLYVDIYKKCLRNISAVRKGLQNSRTAHFYVKCKMKASRMLDVSIAYERSCVRALNWHQNQLSVGGTPMPLSKELRFPSFQSGLKGLGLKE